jgi:hypothetical protein
VQQKFNALLSAKQVEKVQQKSMQLFKKMQQNSKQVEKRT